MHRTPIASLALAVALAAPIAAAPAQDLRKAIVDADLVVVARQLGQKPVTDEVTVHRLQVIESVRGGGAEPATVAVLDWPQLALHHRPTPRQSRLYCLQDQSKVAAKLGLDPAAGPYYRMVGWAGSNPLIGQDRDQDPVVRFARVLTAAENGAPPQATADAIARAALEAEEPVRTEATRLLAERPALRARLSPVQWNALATRVSGETEDVDYKVALAELCAEQRVPGLAEALILGLSQVRDAEYARTAGRLCAYLHGEDAARRIVERMPFAGDEDGRKALLIALGATRTDAALQTLLQWKREAGADAAIDAGLRAHRSPRALEAAGSRSGKEPGEGGGREQGR